MKEEEDKAIDGLLALAKENNIKFQDPVWKRGFLLRFLQAKKYSVREGLKAAIDHGLWRKQNLPPVLSERISDLLVPSAEPDQGSFLPAGNRLPFPAYRLHPVRTDAETGTDCGGAYRRDHFFPRLSLVAVHAAGTGRELGGGPGLSRPRRHRHAILRNPP